MELFYLPPISEFRKLIGKDEVQISLVQPFRKMSFHNRAIIASANGLINLSVPVKGGREVKGQIKDIRIDNSQPWQVRQWRTITSAYGRSPWFEFFEPSLETYFDKEYEYLADWNIDMLKWVVKMIGIPVKLDFKLVGDEASFNQIKSSNYQRAEFTEVLKPYTQVFQDRIGYQVNLSIIDLLFNEGKSGLRLITT